MTLDAAFHASNALTRDTPEETLALVAVGRRGGRPSDEVVRRRRRDWVDHRLQRFLVDVHLLRGFRMVASSLKRASQRYREKIPRSRTR